jgi:LmbE family N-acetylglucosaminyl deacetylase
MKTKILLLTLLASLFGSCLAAQTQNLTIDRGIMGLTQALDRLPYISRVMFIAAHPDDENSGVLPYVSRGLHAKTALLTLTRGEGGQNLIGPDLFDALGLIRTGELLAAGEYYGVEQFFTRAFDFGFSRSSEETLQKWGKDIVLSDMVRAIRHFRPHIVISVWRGEPSDGHGHHQASGLLAREAFHAAGDPARFPELLQEGLGPWQPQKLYIRSRERRDKDKKEDETKRPTVTVDPGKHVPLLGASFQEIASQGYSSHRSQGAGASYSPPGSRRFSYDLVFPQHSQDSGFFDGVNVRVGDLAKLLPGGVSEKTWLDQELNQVQASITRAREQLQPADFSRTLEPLLAGIRRVRDISRSLANSPAASNQEALRFFLRHKEDDFSKALELAAGFYFEALSADAEITPGQTFEVAATVVNRSPETIGLQQIELLSEKSWKSELREGTVKPLAPSEKLTFKYHVTVPAQEPPSRPQFTRNNKRDTVYAMASKDRTNARIAPKLSARLAYRISDVELSRVEPVEYLDSDRLKGTRKIPLMVVPPVALEVGPAQQLVSTAAASQNREVQVKLANNTPTRIAGAVLLRVPGGWSAEPRRAEFTLASEGESQTFKFLVRAGKGLVPGRTSFEAIAEVNNQTVDESYRLYSVLDLWRFPLYQKAASEVVAFDYKLPQNLKVGYIMGAGDRLPETLSQLGVAVKLIEAEEIASGDLQQYSCIVAGVRAYDVREDLIANNARLLDYVKRGGLCIVQYHRQATWNKAQYAPYPAKIKSEEHRVTDETAPVKILDPAHPVFLFPNKITDKDFDHWVQERGAYFIQERDPRFKALLSCGDPGQAELDGGLLVADYGQGKYVLTSYAWFRQLPEGVPGAIRIFINLMSLKGNQRP